MNQYWLIFTDSPAWYLRPLRPGFRHLWIAGFIDGIWVKIDLRVHGIDISTAIMEFPFMPQTTFEICQMYREQVDHAKLAWLANGYTVVPVTPGCGGKLAFLGLLTCVGMAKRFLGMRAPLILTPFKLYRFLTGTN